MVEGFCWKMPPPPDDEGLAADAEVELGAEYADDATGDVETADAAAEDEEPPLAAPPEELVILPIVPSEQPLEVPVQPVSLLARSEA